MMNKSSYYRCFTSIVIHICKVDRADVFSQAAKGGDVVADLRPFILEWSMLIFVKNSRNSRGWREWEWNMLINSYSLHKYI